MWSCDYTPLLFLLLMDQWLGGWAPSLVRPGSNPGCACRSVSVSLDNGGSFVLFTPHWPPSPFPLLYVSPESVACPAAESVFNRASLPLCGKRLLCGLV